MIVLYSVQVLDRYIPWECARPFLSRALMQQSYMQRMIKHTCYFNTPPRRSAGAEAETGTEKSARCTACHKGGWTAGWLIRYSNAKQVDAIAAELFCCEEAKWSRAKAKESRCLQKCSDPSSRFGIVARILATVVQRSSMTYVAG